MEHLKTPAPDFSERMMRTLNEAAVALMISIGHRSGLFDAMGDSVPATADQIAAKAKLHERYVREWLGAVTTGGIVRYDPERRSYLLPEAHAAWLTRKASPNNLAALAQYFPVLASVEDDVLACFREGGGVPYSAYKRFHEVMAEDSGQSVLPVLREQILPLVPGLIEKLEKGIEVLDLGCGSGRALNLMAGLFPQSRFRGYDFSEEAVAFARAEAEAAGLRNLSFAVKDVTRLGESAEYDLITAFDAIHDQMRPQEVLNGIAAALKPDGVFLMQDIKASSDLQKNLDHPIGPFLYTVSCLHCMTVSLAGGGEGLGTMWGIETAKKMLRQAGFSRVDVRDLSHDLQNCYYIARI